MKNNRFSSNKTKKFTKIVNKKPGTVQKSTIRTPLKPLIKTLKDKVLFSLTRNLS